jgi:Asp-tRNA(Asn)/Glu-tRNA(Gln) amidotransferase A subunit family amidase
MVSSLIWASVEDDFEPFPVLSSDDRFSSFALSSRIKTRAASSSFFAGMRVLVKDNIHLKGIKTSVGNRAFYETYPPQPESAECVQKLIDQGAVIGGKTKMNSLATWEEPTQYIDYQAPWNPRADHYQSTGGSSSGSAAAVATYDWLDMVIGTDSKSRVLAL